jgi:hypothetical protein
LLRGSLFYAEERREIFNILPQKAAVRVKKFKVVNNLSVAECCLSNVWHDLLNEESALLTADVNLSVADAE